MTGQAEEDGGFHALAAVLPRSGPDAALDGLEVYVVGGAVRDALLGLPAGDRDWVVVGASPDEMAARGFMPVGGDFPVFLHPVTKEEFALARTERKTARGYQGFTFYTGPEVGLADDLARRDLTVNAIACDRDGRLADPLHGVRDLQARVLRHVGPAFSEDPVRILRLARFAARFPDFSVAEETTALCRAMVDSAEVDALVPERVWKELSRGLMAGRPSRMLGVLRQCGALARIAPDLVDDAGIDARVDAAARSDLDLPSRYALMCLGSAHAPGGEAIERIGRHWRVPAVCADYARLLPRVVAAPSDADTDAVLALMEQADAPRKPDRFVALIRAAAVVSDVDEAVWGRRLHALQGVDAGAIARTCAGEPSRIKAAVRQARLDALA